MSIKKITGYQAPDGTVFPTMSEAAEHICTMKIKSIIGSRPGSISVSTIVKNSREIEIALREYNGHCNVLNKAEAA